MAKMDRQETNEIGINASSIVLLGDYLKQRRIDKNYTLEKLSQKTKISINILKSLEANDYDHLPSAAYIKGFVTSYVKVLGIPLEDAINKMEYTYLNVLGKPFPALNHTKLMATLPSTTTGKGAASDENPSPSDVIESGDSIMENTKSFLPILIFGVIILVFVGGYKLISSIVDNEVTDQKIKDLGPKIESSSALVKQNLKPNETKKSESGDQSNSDQESSSLAATKNEEAKPEVEFQRSFPAVDFKKVKGPLFAAKMDAPENSDQSIFPQQMKDKTNSDLQNVYIKAVDGNTWLSYKIDSNPIESVIINKGSDLFLQGSEIRIFLGNVNVTKIFYNNYLIETPTKNGVKSLVFPEESNSKYQLPLFPKAKDDILYTAEDYIKRMNMEEDELKKRKEAQ
jgi:cytoskeleton protein RodZ